MRWKGSRLGDVSINTCLLLLFYLFRCELKDMVFPSLAVEILDVT